MLTDDQVIALIERWSDNYGLVALAEQHGIDKGQLSQILSGKRPLSKRVAEAFGYRQVVMYEKR